MAGFSREDRMRKLEGLLRKAEAAGTEEERETFFAKAAQLMGKWEIDEAELRMAGEGVREEVAREVFVYSTNDGNLPGKRAIMHTVCYIIGGVRFAYYSGSRHAQQGLLLGFPDAIARAQMLYASLIIQARHGAFDAGYTGKKHLTSFMVGFADGAHSKASEWKAARDRGLSSSTALAIVDRQQEVDDAMDKAANKCSRNYTADAQAMDTGFFAGTEADIGQEVLTS